MSCNQDDEWEYVPVETADEIMLCGDVVESKSLRNWNRWLKIRKQQHKYLGLMVCRSSASLLMNKSDKFRSKVECKWLVDAALKLKANNEYCADFPYSIAKEINNFTSIYIPYVIRTEKGLSGIKKDARFDLQTPNKVLLYNELNTLKSLIPFKSSEKLAIIGENILKKAMKHKFDYKGTIPSVYVESTLKKNKCNIALVYVRVNDYIIQSINDSTICTTTELKTNPKIVNIVKINEDSWDEIIIENCGQISVNYKWIEEEYTATKYDCFLKQKQKKCFFFDTRTYTLGPGQIKHLTVLFRPTRTGPHREMWFLQINILRKLDHIARISVPLQGCAISNVNNISSIVQLQNTILSEKCNGLLNKSTSKDHQNVILEEKLSFIEKYHYHDEKMTYLYHTLQTENSKSIEELLYQCMRLKESLKEKCLNLISQTAVTLLKKEIVFEHSQMNHHELNAHKIMYITMDCIDLIISTYEFDHDEVCQEMYKIPAENQPKSVINDSDNDEISAVDITTKQKFEYAKINEEWFEMIKPMIKKRLEWAIERILDYDILWRECKHENSNETIKNEHKTGTLGIESYEHKECSLSLVRQFFINKYL
ncbi:uncharacterized protein LOC113550231 [Rhopalosiphum maidis]|uniref:uncharacterized protein LOC113550231 n=1 Tax=Rhopalosiphum maidis TaxID=43146 RepID=UPI000F00B721|nr:uncharacterized protein LOC113550231 [Rhopalosiphum maidis]